MKSVMKCENLFFCQVIRNNLQQVGIINDRSDYDPWWQVEQHKES